MRPLEKINAVIESLEKLKSVCHSSLPIEKINAVIESLEKLKSVCHSSLPKSIKKEFGAVKVRILNLYDTVESRENAIRTLLSKFNYSVDTFKTAIQELIEDGSVIKLEPSGTKSPRYAESNHVQRMRARRLSKIKKENSLNEDSSVAFQFVKRKVEISARDLCINYRRRWSVFTASCELERLVKMGLLEKCPIKARQRSPRYRVKKS